MAALKFNSQAFSLAPSLKALLIQVVALLVIAIALICLKLATGMSLPLTFWILLSGLMAAILAVWRRMDWWWVVMELLFAPALLVVNTWSIPPVVFLVAFLLLLGVFWSTYRTQVPLFLSGTAVWDAVETILPDRPLRCIDIGSGLGGAMLALAERRPDCAFFGVEIAPLPWLISVVRARIRRSRTQFTRRDYRTINLADYDVVFSYLSPAAMPSLWQQATAQMVPESMLISYEFGLAAISPDAIYQLDGSKSTLFLWYPAAHHRAL